MRSYRVDKLASIIREIVSDAIANKLNDPRVSPLTSVTRVEVTGDLQMAKVYVSVMGQDSQARKTIAGLSNATGHVQRLLSKRLTIRRCPELRFVIDESLKKAARMSRIIEEAVRQDRGDDRQGDKDELLANGAPE